MHTYTCCEGNGQLLNCDSYATGIIAYVWMYICANMYMCRYEYIHTYIEMKDSLTAIATPQVYTYIWMCVCVHICKYTYIYIYGKYTDDSFLGKRQRDESPRISILMDINNLQIKSLLNKLSLGITLVVWIRKFGSNSYQEKTRSGRHLVKTIEEKQHQKRKDRVTQNLLKYINGYR